MAMTGHNLQHDGDSHMADQSLNPHAQTSSHVQPPVRPAGQDPHIVTPPAPPHLPQGPLPGSGNMSFEEHIAQHASTHQPFAPSTPPFVVPPVESVPPAPSIQWQPDPPLQPLHSQAVLPRQAQPPKSNCNPPQAQRFSAPAIKGPMPARSREAEDNDGESGRARKRLRGDQFKPVNDPAPIAQSSVPASTSMANANAALVEAARQLAQPRDPVNGASGGPANTQQSNAGTANHDDLEGVCQPEKDEIMRNLYEGNIEDENSPDMQQMYRLVEKVFLKQDAILRGLRQPRSTPNGGNGSSQPGVGSSQPGSGSSGPSGGRPPRTSPHQPPKKVNWDQTIPSTEPAGRQPRLARRILIQKEIRLLIMHLLKLKTYKPPFPPAPVDARFPTTDTFGIRWDEKERSIFNMLAVNVVVEEICRAWQHDRLTPSEKEEMPDMVREHIRYLCRIHNNALKPDALTLKKVQLKSASASSRRQTLYESRLKVLDRFPDALTKHCNLIIRLGLQGTSSDEEDPTQQKVYLIKRHKELSSRVQVLKSKLDLVYNLWFKGPGSRGSQMHVRVPSNKVSERPIKVEGLPITCLNRAWLRSLSAPEREFYQFEGHLYDYSFPDELLNRNVGRTPNSIVLSEDEAA
ncbi:hypothetical protein FS749_010980 [Ceratobasidium sp. UAMH 11750]|nr:hypothetical protein FS749_010980 [Ceratobasidium sp. UAMH 11750]